LNRVTIGKAVPCESRRTVAADSVRTHRADCIGGARIGSNTGVDTTPVPADLLVPTLAVRCATRFWSRRELAIDICIPDISGNAHANHSPLWQGVLHTALSVASARLQFCAGIPANLLQTGLPTGTISVNTALWLYHRDGEAACCVRITLVVGDALTTCPVAAHYAICIDSTVTRIYAFLIPACEHLGALFVDHTLWVVAFYVGVASPPIGAEAASSVISCFTASSYAALR